MGEQALNRASFDAWERFSNSRSGVALLFLWAAAEAVVWPIIPDFVLAPMALGGRQRFWALLGSTVLGSALGGAGLYLFAFFAPDAAWAFLLQLPVVQTFMIKQATLALDQQGAGAFWTQPWSGISYKVYAILGGVRGLDPVTVIPLSILARGLRMLANAAATAWLGSRFRGFFRDFWIYCLLAYTLIVGYVWISTQIIGPGG